MFQALKRINRQFALLSGISLFLLLSILATHLISRYFESTIDGNWEQISAEKTNSIKDECTSLFDSYQKETIQFSSELLKNKKLLTAIGNQNTRKSYEALFESDRVNDYNIEIYNPRLELFLFSGRQIYPDILELNRALSGSKFTTVKEIGFYTYVVVFTPIPVQQADKVWSGKAGGVLVTAKLIDVRYGIRNKFFRNLGITQEITDKYNISVTFDFKPYTNLSEYTDSSSLKEKLLFELKNSNGEIMGQMFIPQLDKASYILDVRDRFSNLISVEIFILNLFIAFLCIYFLKKIDSLFIRGIMMILLVVISRYLWLAVDFPSKIIMSSGLDIFSPSHYASSVAYGIGRSLGELFITSILVLIICSYIISLVIKSYRKEVLYTYTYVHIFIITLCIFIFFLAFHVYGGIIQSLVYDSNLRYFDRTQILPTDQPELIFMQLAVLFISITFLLILISCAITINKYSSGFFGKNILVGRYSVIMIFLALFIINLLLELFDTHLTELSLTLGIRNLIIILSGLLTFYIQRKLMLEHSFKLTSLLNFSMIVLACIIFVPIVMLNKITSQENKYLELTAKKISEQADDKIRFLISSSLQDISENPSLELDLKNKNKYPKLAFNIWTQSTLYSEDLNTGVFILDPDGKPVSDFNVNPSELLSDSVVSFALRNIKRKPAVPADTSIINPDKTEDLSEEESSAGDEEEIFQNREMKFYCGIKPIGKVNLKNSKFKRVIGYLVIAAQYDAKNFLAQSSMQIFRNFSQDNLINKLTSAPVISEFSDGELVGSSDKDLSRSFIKSLDLFKESVKDKIDKSSLRYDQVENQLYKSYYVESSPVSKNDMSPEKIYVVSIKVNDFNLMIFFFFKYFLFAIVIYIIFIIFYICYKLTVYMLKPQEERTIKFGFREKLFVSFIVVSVIPIIVLAIYSREFVKEKNNEFYKNQMISDLRIVEQYVKNKMPSLDYSKMKTEGSGENGVNIFNIFGKGFTESRKNFNLYVKTRLVSTTDEQLYKSDLLDERISGNAFYNIALLKKDYYAENQDIGSLTVLAGYKPMYDNFNNLIGIISSQTVFRQNEINQELTENLVYIFGVYFVAVLFLIMIVNILSYTISNPIIKLQKATEQLSRGNIEIQVSSSSKDEIGELVNSFNKMTRELKRSRAELKKVERESAWRDIARQVAHEIKNPLTPMKLAMQHLYYAYSHSSGDFKSILQTTNRLIIDQIETLNRIATEFSDFAKMPSRNYQPINIDEILLDVVGLLNSDGKITLKLFKANSKSSVTGDRDEVKRALINIIRNSLQAIDEKVCDRVDGHISIETVVSNGFYRIFIKDNGIGMDEDTLQSLFEPYFSTKSSGMGLGLVITKKIIDDMKGKIFVKSVQNKGTEVEIRFECFYFPDKT
ncbi:MAG: ATP-binding protein [Ignavibacteria bacterium]|jgi:nitrogen fixation/metabolism regulation signal transduction histidine kinase